MLPRQCSYFSIPAQSRSHSFMSVGAYSYPIAAAAHQNSRLSAIFLNYFSHSMREIRIVGSFSRISSFINYGMAFLLQEINHLFLQFESGMVSPYGDNSSHFIHFPSNFTVWLTNSNKR